MIDAKKYLENKKRIKKAEEVLDEGNKWNIPKYKPWIDEFNKLVEENLEFESAHKINSEWPNEEKLEKELETS